MHVARKDQCWLPSFPRDAGENAPRNKVLEVHVGGEIESVPGSKPTTILLLQYRPLYHVEPPRHYKKFMLHGL